MGRGHNHESGAGNSDISAHVTRIGVNEHASDGVVIPDTELMFSAKYTKSGADLVLTGQDGHKIVLTGYFDQARHADLVTLGGAMLPADVVAKLTMSQTPGQYAQAGAPAGALVIGKVERLGGSATVQHANGTVEELKVGDSIRQGDVVETRDGSLLGMTLTDGTAFNMGANARMVLSELLYDSNTNANSAVFSLVKGQITFVAGQVAKTGDMRVETPVATMGIRGTSVNTNINADINGNVMSVTYSLMRDPDGHIGSFNILDRQTGAIIGTVTTTDTMFVLTPSANLGLLASQIDKTPNQIVQELAVAQALFTIFVANPANFINQPVNPQDLQPKNNPPVNPQDLQLKSGTNVRGEFDGGSSQSTAGGLGIGHNPVSPPPLGPPPLRDGSDRIIDPINFHLTNNGAPSIFSDRPEHLVEAIRFGRAGSPTAIAHIFKIDLDGQVYYDTDALISSGWMDLGYGIFSKRGSYGIVTLNTGTSSALELVVGGWSDVGGGLLEKHNYLGRYQTAVVSVSIQNDSVTYTLDNYLADPLRQVDHPTESFVIPVIDNSMARAWTRITYTIDGMNDPPVIEAGPGDPSGAVVEGQDRGTHTASGAILFTDPEADGTYTASAVRIPWHATGGQFTLRPPVTDTYGRGSVVWLFDPRPSDYGMVWTELYTYEVTIDDGHAGGTVSQLINLKVGGPGPDPISGEPGIILIGGAGTDYFNFNVGFGKEIIADFNPGHDLINFLNHQFASTQDVINAALDDGHGNTVITLDADNILTLANIAKAQLHLSDFNTLA